MFADLCGPRTLWYSLRRYRNFSPEEMMGNRHGQMLLRKLLGSGRDEYMWLLYRGLVNSFK